MLRLDSDSFFDSMSRARLRELLDRRICNGALRRAIDKWLNSGAWKAR